MKLRPCHPAPLLRPLHVALLMATPLAAALPLTVHAGTHPAAAPAAHHTTSSLPAIRNAQATTLATATTPQLLAAATSRDTSPAAALTDSPSQRCTELKSMRIAGTRITSTSWSTGGIEADSMAAFTGGQAASQQVGAHCVIEGEIGARTGADGKHYGTRFQLRLPEQWNKAFLFQGGGGVDGFVAPAVGNIPFQQTTATPALKRGYAVVSMDGGHPTPTPDFGADQQARLDFAYQSTGKVTAVAKKLVMQFYQASPRHSYFMGCSNGGREAMIAAQRYPLEFDGVIAANPGFRLSRAAVAEVWDTQQLMAIAPPNAHGQKILANALTQQDLDLVSQAVTEKCDAKDGLKDGVINAWERCDFDPAVLQCADDNATGSLADNLKTASATQTAGKAHAAPHGGTAAGPKSHTRQHSTSTTGSSAGTSKVSAGSQTAANDAPLPQCLPAAKVKALKAIFGGAKNSHGEPIYSGWFYDSGINQPNWRQWKLGDSQTAKPNANNVILGGGSLTQYFMTPFNPAFDLTKFDFDRDTSKTYQTGALNDAISTDLSTFRKNGGRLIIITGVSDPVFSAMDQRDWFKQMQADTPKAQDFSRMFMVPGMNHCGGGNAFNDFDPLTALENWHNQDRAPDYLVAQGKAFPNKQMPLCAWPKVATYTGGIPGKLNSFTCR